jgi:S-DNA-T family DNA segregation ATPase FtsK/SpoIIIE
MPVGEILSAIGRVTGTAGALWNEARQLTAEERVSETGLRDGTVLGMGVPSISVRDRVDAGVELRVVGGPASGLVLRLPSGYLVIGRHSSCDLTIPDLEMSRKHAALEISADGAITLVDLGSSNGTWLEGAAIGEVPAPVKYGQVAQVGASYVSLHPVDPLDGDLSDDGQCGFVFNRRYRIRQPQTSVEIEFPAKPEEDEKPSFPWLMMVAPLILAGGMALVLKQPQYLLLAVMSPVMTLGSTVHGRQTRKRRKIKAETDFQQGTAEAMQQMESAVQEERLRRRSEAPDPATLVLAAMGPRGRLWERRSTDDDHLWLRVGLATQGSVVHIANHPSPPPAWAVPVVVPLPVAGVLAISAPTVTARALARALVLQTGVLHSPDDVRVVVLTDESAEAEWDWVRWLPHAQLDPSRGVVAIGNNPDTVAARVRELQRNITARVDQRKSLSTVAGRMRPHVVLVVDGAKRFRSLPGMLSVLQDGPDVGIYSICLDEDRSLLPEESGAVVTWDATTATATVEQHGTPALSGVALDLLDPRVCETAARAIAPIHRIGGEGAGGVPAAARFLELADLDPPSGAAMSSRWQASGRGPRALLGMAEHGPLVLDLAVDGPHGLVAGTTGAGKSELLQTLVAGLATSSPPDELNVVLVDYKGGAAFRDCRALPHTVGLVTDLDAHLTERALRSLQAELKRREHLLSEAGAKDIGDYIEARERTLGDLAPLPRLVIVIDEFASLALELPDFLKGLVGIAQRGRSLGVHLVLATQRPTGVVSPEIRANANFAIALRVVNNAESSDIIGVPDAANISPATPGRAFLRVSQEPAVCFQAARVGGRRPGAVDVAPTVDAFDVPWGALGTPDPAVSPPAVLAEDATDLHDLVEAIRQAAETQAVPPQRQPWLDPLPSLLTVDRLLAAVSDSREAEGSNGMRDIEPLPFGLYDLPDLQEQRPAYFDPVSGRHTLFAGSPRSGRSSLLRTIAASVARSCDVTDVHLYVVDCGNGSLLTLRDLPHCGAVVTRNEPDRTERLFGRLVSEVHRRQSVLVERGLSSAREQRRHSDSGQPWPFIVVLVDGWEGFLDAFHDHKDGSVEQQLLGLLRDGGPVGLTVVMTGDRTLLSTARVSSLFEDRFVLRFNDRDDYSLANLTPRKMPETVPAGRAFRVVTGDELQVALLGEDPSGPAQASALATLASAVAEQAAAHPPPIRPFRVDALPSRISLDEAALLGDRPEPPGRSSLAVLVGVGGDELTSWWVDLAEHGPGFVVTGSPESGRSTALLSFGATLLSRGCHIIAVTPRQSPLRALNGRSGVLVLDGGEARSPGTEGRSAVESMVKGVGDPSVTPPLVVLVDDAELVDPDDPWLTELASGPAGRCAFIVAGALEPLRDGFRGFPLYAKRTGSGMLMSPKSHLDAGVFNGALPRGSAFSGPPGRAYLFVRSRPLALVQIPNT